ncbi:hypothetical protein BC938DRAFT_472846 [Jimgerdemannia flammicorona]|uniref:Zn(2)-C6 fungal-type domain-containing protein n=1 Tax=Jimgerdemannia flammicorona TaxID=994334 RepID=A0A433Q585_9FUNG|nr:hypothetical protein BC938DRAFT_472846 [Jimgerdemannia flammicorona]
MSSEQRQYSTRSSFPVKYDAEGRSIPTNPDYRGCSICMSKSHFCKHCPLNPNRVAPEQYTVAAHVLTKTLVEQRGIYTIYQFREDDLNGVEHGHAQIDTGADVDFMSYKTCCRLRLQGRLTNPGGLGCSLQRAGRYYGRLENIHLFLGIPGAEEEVVVISPIVHDHPDIDILIGCPTCANEGWTLAPRDNAIYGPHPLHITTYSSVDIVNQQLEDFLVAVETQDEHLTDKQRGTGLDLLPENIRPLELTSAYVLPADMNSFSMPLQQVSHLVSHFPAPHNHMPATPASISEIPMEYFDTNMLLRRTTTSRTSSTIDETAHGDAPNGGTLPPLNNLNSFPEGQDIEMLHVQEDTPAATCALDVPTLLPLFPEMLLPVHPMALSEPVFAYATGEFNSPSEIVKGNHRLPSDTDTSLPTVPAIAQQHGHNDSVFCGFHVWDAKRFPPANKELRIVLENGLPSKVRRRRLRQNQSATSPPPCDGCIRSKHGCDSGSPCVKCKRMGRECLVQVLIGRVPSRGGEVKGA